jgi:hypothetical protein
MSDTISAKRRVLVLIRNPAATNRLLDVLSLLDGDFRLDVFFAIDGGSAFASDLPARLISQGFRVMDWDHALSQRFDLVLAASDNSDLHRVRAPLVLLPHGVGYHRVTKTGVPSGISGTALIHNEHIVPRLLVVAHPHQVDTIRAIDPRLVPRTLVAGDPCLDRIVASSRRRDRFRIAFDTQDRHLVTVASTWGKHSLFGTHPELAARLVHELPLDRFRVALVLHPNVSAHHSPQRVRSWLRPALDAGLIALPPEEGWRAAILASEIIISDHSSVTCYALGAGKPVLMAADGGPEVVLNSPMDALRNALPALNHGDALQPQIEQAMAKFDPTALLPLTDNIFAHRAQSAQVLRTALYHILDLPEPRNTARLPPIPDPVVQREDPDALRVNGEVTAHTAGHPTVHLERFVATAESDDAPGHLAVQDTAADPALLERAAVIWTATAYNPNAATEWLANIHANYPGACLASVKIGDTVTMSNSDGHIFTLSTHLDAGATASAVYVCHLRGITNLTHLKIHLSNTQHHSATR